MPLLTRTLVQLVTLVPGVSSDLREDACFCDQGNLDISINGARRSAVNWLLDGASNVNGWNNYTLVTTPSLEAIQEVNVITSSYGAEWSRNGGGVVNAVTKSGTNRFSGSAYEFLRNDALNANSFFRNMDPQEQVNSSPPRLRYNNFGYTIGGPVLPGRRKLFFFFSEEWRRSHRDKRSVGQAGSRPGVAHRFEQRQLRGARVAGRQCREAPGALACAECSRNESVSDARSRISSSPGRSSCAPTTT